MVEGENQVLSDNNNNNNTSEDEVRACALMSGTQNNNNGGVFTNSDLDLNDGSDDGSCASCASEEDEEILRAQENLVLAKKEEKMLRKKQKLERIANEMKEVERSVKSLRKKTTAKEKLSMVSLRKMDDVEAEVNELMDKKMNIKSVVSSSEGSDDEAEEQVEVRSKSSSSGRKKELNKKKGRNEKANSTSGLHKSGKSKTLTSFVQFPQEWPHSHLSLNFVSRPKEYEELSIPEFCAGYAGILEIESEEVRHHRRKHLKDLMYLATQYHWRNVLNFHAACLLEIERGNLTWGSDFRDLQITTLAGGFINSYQSRFGNTSNFHRSNSSENSGVLFCKGFQKGTCQQPKDHYGYFMGNSRLLKHICAKCWLTNKTQLNHPEESDQCPFHEK